MAQCPQVCFVFYLITFLEVVHCFLLQDVQQQLLLVDKTVSSDWAIVLSKSMRAQSLLEFNKKIPIDQALHTGIAMRHQSSTTFVLVTGFHSNSQLIFDIGMSSSRRKYLSDVKSIRNHGYIFPLENIQILNWKWSRSATPFLDFSFRAEHP